MALNDYTKNPRSDGYRGYRVSWSENGIPRQKYFPVGHEDEAKMWSDYMAQKYPHRAALTAQRHSAQYRYSAPRYGAPRRTAVVGITIGFNPQRKCTPVRYYPTFFFNCHNKTKAQADTGSRMITPRRDLAATWLECCETLAQWRGYKQAPIHWLENSPTIEDFETLRLWYCNHGTQISANNMTILTHGVRS